MAYLIYWIHETQHTDPYNEGYIGITNNLTRRLSLHKKHNQNPIVSNKIHKSLITILEDDLTQEQALLKEESYRPNENIGWNINKGGFMPPSQKGKTYNTQKLLGENRTEKQKQSSLDQKERAEGGTACRAVGDIRV
jgi:predicted GIY-YIG superfamily endonuclease